MIEQSLKILASEEKATTILVLCLLNLGCLKAYREGERTECPHLSIADVNGAFYLELLGVSRFSKCFKNNRASE